MRAQTCSDAPCKNGAHCSNTPGSGVGYQCRCPSNFHGVNCDIPLDSCRVTPCQNGGTCQLKAGSLDNYQCRCPIGFTGRNCEVNINDCALNPCQNGGSCMDFVNAYKCFCKAGFSGTNCEHNVNECAARPCANGGICHDGINDFTCTCPPGFTGKDCSREVNPCDPSPCMKGFCKKKKGDFECKCHSDYSGRHCNISPDGTVLPFTAGEKSESQNWPVIIGLSVGMPIIVCIAIAVVMCRKRHQRHQQKRQDAEAERENELNAVNVINKTKMLDDHMIVNALDYPKPKKNPNLADEELFRAKTLSGSGCSSKQLNTDLNGSYLLSSRASMLLSDKLENASSCLTAASSGSPCSSSASPSSRPHYVDKPRLSNLPSAGRKQLAYDSSNASSCGASSVCSRYVN